MWSYWPVTLFWKAFGVFPVTLNNDRASVLFTTFLLVSSPFLFFFIPTVICNVGMKCTTETIRILKEIYPGVLNVTSTFSRVALLYCVRYKFPRYKEILESYETYSPTTAADVGRYKAFTLVSVSVCVALAVPVNALQLHRLLSADEPDASIVALYAYGFVQNLSMCCSETQFAEHCFALYCELRKINREIVMLNAGPLMDFARYLHSSSRANDDDDDDDGPSAVVVYADTRAHVGRGTTGDDPTADGSRSSAANAIEALRIRHWLIREAVGSLNGLFGIQLGMSVCTLCIMSFFDIYYETFRVMGDYALSTVAVYTLQLHFAVRYIGIIMISHFTTKQALRTKTLIANLKSSYLDCNINKELHLFLDQVSHSSVEFTACDIFTLNIRLITSTIAAGITYLVILVQYQTDKKGS